MNDEVGWIYTIHLHARLGRSGRNGALHYTGWTSDLPSRLREHRNGQGSRMLAWCAAKQIGWHVGALRRGTRADERRLKQHGASRWCWSCRYGSV